MTPHPVTHVALLDDPRFWCLLYEGWLQPVVGDPFAEGEEYFFSTRHSTIDDFFRGLDGLAVGDGAFPKVPVLVSLTNGWHAGVDLVMCPGDFGIDYVVVPPSGERHIVGVHGGNSWLPALRWEEVLSLAGAIRPTATVSRARAILLFYPACYPAAEQLDQVRVALHQAWGEVGFPVRHLEEWVARTVDGSCAGPGWRRDATYGWVCEGHGSFRNPRLVGQFYKCTAGMMSAVAEFFGSLEGEGPPP
jgi:hypothetical protein